MNRSRVPIFLQRHSYRQRRLVDTARAIPAFGAVMFFIPLTWSLDAEGDGNLAARGIYLFVVWILLVLITAFVSVRLQKRFAAPEATNEHETKDDSHVV